MAPKLITIVGATGAQGRGVVQAFANNPDFQVRALTRNPSSESAQSLLSLGDNVKLHQADANDPSSLSAAFAGSNIIFAVTNFFEPFATFSSPEKAMDVEAQQGINMARAAAAVPELEHYIWSTLPDLKTLSGGKRLVPHFEGKNRIDRFIRSELPDLLAKTTFCWVTFYSSNYGFPMFSPCLVPTAGKHVMFANYAPDTPITTIGDVTTNIGVFVKAAVANPEKTKGGNAVVAGIETITGKEVLEIWGKVKGVQTQFVRVSGQDYRDLWPLWGEEIGLMMEAWDELRERSWTSVHEGQVVLTANELGVGVEEELKVQSYEDGLKA